MPMQFSKVFCMIIVSLRLIMSIFFIKKNLKKKVKNINFCGFYGLWVTLFTVSICGPRSYHIIIIVCAGSVPVDTTLHHLNYLLLTRMGLFFYKHIPTSQSCLTTISTYWLTSKMKNILLYETELHDNTTYQFNSFFYKAI